MLDMPEEKPKDGHLAIVSEPQPSCFQALLIQFEPRRPKVGLVSLVHASSMLDQDGATCCSQASMLPLRSCHRQATVQ